MKASGSPQNLVYKHRLASWAAVGVREARPHSRNLKYCGAEKQLLLPQCWLTDGGQKETGNSDACELRALCPPIVGRASKCRMSNKHSHVV